VIGKKFDDAEEQLEERGLKAEQNSDFPFGGRRSGRVVGQDPDAGTKVDPGTTVTLDTVGF
jgi:eukaryotic-like serine/threonine-protein kinase